MIEKISIFIVISVVLYFTLGLVLVWRQKKDGEKKLKNKEILGVSVLFSFFIFSGLKDWVGIGYEIPESGFETNKEYRRKFYVNIFPDMSKGTNYRVPALIYATWHGFTEGPDIRCYRIEKATLPSGRTLTFGETGEDILELNEKEYVIADDDSGWYIELTDKPVL